MATPPHPAAAEAKIWFKLVLPSGALGPGKIALMRAIAASGSVSAAARVLRMSHARSVKLVAEVNALAATPLIDTRAGGPSGGGASLTPLGSAVVAAFADVEAGIRSGAQRPFAELSELLAGSSHPSMS